MKSPLKLRWFCLCRLPALLVLISILINSTGCQQRITTPLSKTGFCLNTVITITLYDANNDELLNEGLKLCKNYDRLFSKTDPDSEIYALNHSSGEAVTVSDETVYLIQKGIEYADKTEGRFNIAIGSVSSLWDFTGENSVIPSQNAIHQALTHTGYNEIVISGNAVTVPCGMQLDLGGIAKGYIGDRLKEFYLDKGVRSALLNLGGNVICIGTPPQKDSFHIGIKKPFSDNEVFTDVQVDDRCVVTSGIYERYFEKDENIYHHILDPDTGYPAHTDLYSVTILSSNSMEADILSTSCLLLGAERAKEFMKSFPDTDYIFITDTYEVLSSF